jgi:hypothetical protein
MRNVIVAAAVAALGLASPAYAASFTVGSYTINHFDEATAGFNALDTEVSKIMAHGTSFDLNFVGDTHQEDLFYIWTDESDRDQSDDKNFQPISVDFLFSSPAFGGTESGVTGGISFNIFAGCFSLFSGCGAVSWGSPAVLAFGTTGLLQITLTDTLFLDDDHAGLVKARFKLLAEDTTPVPEPGTLALFGVGLATAGARLRRKFSSKA